MVMKMPEKPKEHLFGETFWKEEGGEKWVKNIELLENELVHLGQLLLERCNVSPGELVLDVGCGGGVTSLALADRTGPSGRVVGADVSALILEVAKKRGQGIENLEFKISDAGNDDLGMESFDLVTSRFGLMFFTRPVAAFCNLRRMLKAEGRMVFLCWRTFEENPWMAEPTAAVFSILPQPERPAPDPDAPGPFSLGEANRLQFVMKSAGFREVSLEPVDTAMNLGDMEEAIYMATQIGPAAKALEEATEEKRTAAVKTLQALLKKYETSEGVCVPGACWLVAARK